jgi:catechol 2,3-dioxygenase-like lactoylglutathione lyase family enzyme
MGHVVLMTDQIDKTAKFYEEMFGFRLSDYTLRPFKAYFYHVNPRHHSLAFLETGKAGIHHIMMELFSIDDVGHAYDIAIGEENRIATTLGRHLNDYMFSFYSRSPSNFFVEYGWGGRNIDPETWTPEEVTGGPSLWGHDRSWLPPEKRAEARALRMKVAHDGVRLPVTVSEGNYVDAASGCAWFSSLKKSVPDAAE